MGRDTEHMPSLHPASQSIQSDKDKNYGVKLIQVFGFSSKFLAREPFSAGLDLQHLCCH